MSRKVVIDLAERAAWTFVQAFAAAIAVTPLSAGKVGLVAAVAAGISALKTFAKNQVV